MSTTTRTRKPRKTAPAPSPAEPTRAELIAAALEKKAHARAGALARGGIPRGPLAPEWIARRANWAAAHVDPYFAPESIAASILRDFNDRRFLALLREHNPTGR